MHNKSQLFNDLIQSLNPVMPTLKKLKLLEYNADLDSKPSSMLVFKMLSPNAQDHHSIKFGLVIKTNFPGKKFRNAAKPH
jgi:hypothetical protein